MAPVPTDLALVFGGVGAFAAAWSLRIQAAQQRRLTAELSKRADFKITIRPVGYQFSRLDADSADLPTDATQLQLRFEIGLSNTGRTAASHCAVSVLAPARYDDLQWTSPNGGLLSDLSPATTSESLDPDNGGESVWISREFDRVALRTPRLSHVMFLVIVPADGRLSVRIRVKAQSDDLPDDVFERVHDYVVHIKRS